LFEMAARRVSRNALTCGLGDASSGSYRHRTRRCSTLPSGPSPKRRDRWLVADPSDGHDIEHDEGPRQNRAAIQNHIVLDQLNHALNSRIMIEQAKGMLAERTHLDMNPPSRGCATTPATTICSSSTLLNPSSTEP
jgi:hypothetical protein